MPSEQTRQFDAAEALDRALEVFCTRGYECAMLPELTRDMGRPSTYAAFRNKERYRVTVLNGLAVQAASRATEKELRLVSELALRVWSS